MIDFNHTDEITTSAIRRSSSIRHAAEVCRARRSRRTRDIALIETRTLLVSCGRSCGVIFTRAQDRRAKHRRGRVRRRSGRIGSGAGGFSRLAHHHQMNHIVSHLLLLGDDDLAAELVIRHRLGRSAVDLGDLVALFETRHSRRRSRLDVLHDEYVLVCQRLLVQSETERVGRVHAGFNRR